MNNRIIAIVKKRFSLSKLKHESNEPVSSKRPTKIEMKWKVSEFPESYGDLNVEKHQP